jgi:deoxyhypusine synthase
MQIGGIFDRTKLKLKSLIERESKINTSSIMSLDSPLPLISGVNEEKIKVLTSRIKDAKKRNAPIILLYGAHLFRNGLSPFINKLQEEGYINHLATNGAGVIHDWEMSYLGKTTEDVSKYMNEGQFGIWEETGYYQNLALILGAASGLGYGEAIGKMISDDQLTIPPITDLKKEIENELKHSPINGVLPSKVALLKAIEECGIGSKVLQVPHKFKKHSIIYNAYRLGTPFSVCPGIGYDIIYTHSLNCGSAIGEAGVTDFLKLANTISELSNGVIIVVGSAVMASQVVEKALSMANNVALQNQNPIENYYIAVTDIQPGNWDWADGEPPNDNPAYYLRFCKSFSRLGGEFSYLEMDNRVFIPHLFQNLVGN